MCEVMSVVFAGINESPIIVSENLVSTSKGLGRCKVFCIRTAKTVYNVSVLKKSTLVFISVTSGLQ